MINAEVERGNNENNVNLLKRFTRRVQSAGILPVVRGGRYSERKPSEYVKKKKALKQIERRKKIAELIKLGKISERPSK